MNTSIFKRIENAKSPDFGDVISNSFDLYKKYFSQGLTHSLIALAVAIPFILIVYIPLIPFYMDMLQNAGDPYYQPNILEDYSIGMIVAWYVLIFVGSFLMQMVNMSVFGHFMKFLRKEETGSGEDIGGYFTILKNNFSKLLLLSLAIMGIAVVSAMLCYLPLFYAMVPLHWIFPIFIFNEKLGVGDTIKAAFKYGNKNWGILLGIGIVAGIMGSLGAIACYIGIIATMFFTHVATFVTYRDSIGFEGDDHDPISNIGKPDME
ncbi:MAG: hypothetical protein K0U54_05725 [Bacteroidetes bacterium]|nr:hypothetical protein [Bacteroidota bacterium]